MHPALWVPAQFYAQCRELSNIPVGVTVLRVVSPPHLEKKLGGSGEFWKIREMGNFEHLTTYRD